MAKTVEIDEVELAKLRAIERFTSVLGIFLLHAYTNFDGKEVVFQANALKSACDIAYEKGILVTWDFNDKTGDIKLSSVDKGIEH